MGSIATRLRAEHRGATEAGRVCTTGANSRLANCARARPAGGCACSAEPAIDDPDDLPSGRGTRTPPCNKLTIRRGQAPSRGIRPIVGRGAEAGALTSAKRTNDATRTRSQRVRSDRSDHVAASSAVERHESALLSIRTHRSGLGRRRRRGPCSRRRSCERRNSSKHTAQPGVADSAQRGFLTGTWREPRTSQSGALAAASCRRPQLRNPDSAPPARRTDASGYGGRGRG
jgi:hypothetical protein